MAITLYSRGQTELTDTWTCATCGIEVPMDRADERGPVDHLLAQGHAVKVIRKSVIPLTPVVV